MMMKLTDNFIVYLVSMLFAGVILTAPVCADDFSTPSNKPLVFGIAPFMSPMALLNRMAPFRDYISRALEREVLIETATDAKEFAKRTLKGRYDFVLTNPTFSLMAMDNGGFEIIATQKKKLSGIFITLENSDVQVVEDLAGKKVGAPPKVGFLGQLIEPYLKNFNFSAEQMPVIKYFNSHNAAVSALRLGDTDATLVVSFMEKHLRQKGLAFKVIHRTDEFPGMTILARQSLGPVFVKRLRYALYDIDKHDKGKKVLSKISMSGYQQLDMMELEKIRPYLPPKTVN